MKEAKTETQERFRRSVGHCQTAQSLFQSLLIYKSRTKHSIDSLTVSKTTRLFLSLSKQFNIYQVPAACKQFQFLSQCASGLVSIVCIIQCNVCFS